MSFFSCSSRSFDYGDKFWLLKNRYFTCKCSSNICRYGYPQRIATNTSSIDNEEEDNEEEQEEEEGEMVVSPTKI